MLETPVEPVDTVSMNELTALLTDQQDLICVLSAYREAEQADSKAARTEAAPPVESADTDTQPAETDAESASESSWVPRLRELEGIPDEQLAPLHGQLIAHGLLRFNLLGRTAGMGYRVTPEGRELLRRASVDQASA